MNVIIDHHRWAAGALAEAIHRLQCDRAVARVLMKIATQHLHGFGGQGVTTDGLTRLGAADLHDHLASGFVAEVVVIANDAMHLGAGEIEPVSDA